MGASGEFPLSIHLCNSNTRSLIERGIPGDYDTRMLSGELKEMEMSKLVKSALYDDAPVLLEYEPTEHCLLSFGKIIREMINWGENHRAIVVRGKV